MTDKLPFLIVYAVIGLLLALWPLVPQSGFFAIKHRPFFMAFVPISLKWRLATGLLGGLLVTSVLPWWLRQESWAPMIFWNEGIPVLLLGIAGLLAMLIPSAPASPNRRFLAAITAAFIVLALFLSFSTLTFAHPEVLHFAWHHWGAYIGPTELLLSGARVMHDFPTQYGLGPTLIIASVCGQSCWQGTFYAIASVTFIFALLIAFVAVRIVKSASDAQWSFIFLLCLAS